MPLKTADQLEGLFVIFANFSFTKTYTWAVQKYKILVRTGSLPASSTDADIFMTLKGSKGDSGERKISSLKEIFNFAVILTSDSYLVDQNLKFAGSSKEYLRNFVLFF